MPDDRAVAIATQLHLLGLSHAGVVELLSQYPHERIERQLAYLPYRKAKRPEAMLVEAVRNNFSPPKEFFYAQAEIARANTEQVLDEGAEPNLGPASPETEGHRTEGAPSPDPVDERMEQGGPSRDLAIPPTEAENGPRI